ncbi:DUF1194 domain-containing protein [Mangrovicoccus sp. HB182678]|uniref:DUF1194 domain-containing protein n=2 Tax=Mangrovicoccus algicola TaxID=2771008 RepID=A0A8J6YXC0_9RHOB|nr:DUF1194 domain-containing protein [Mangrovicoccus algicola]MBE3638074.1 DUF1194 domain-containing protein [Mangrovicoccus algicola]
MPFPSALLRLACLSGLLGVCAPALAEEVELELVLLADASGSIDRAETQFQREGYATAMTSPEVLGAIRQTAYGVIAVTYVEWASAGEEDVVVPWMRIDGPESAAAFAGAILDAPRRAFGRNAIGSALLTGRDLIEGNAYEGWRKVIDFSGDSANSWNGPPVEAARAEVLAAGITINGLAILCRDCSGRPGGGNLEQQYRDRIIGGPGAFVVTAESRDTFAAAVRRKLVLEIGGTHGGARFAGE